MSQIIKKFLADNSIDASKIQLGNDTSIRSRNAANDADISILKVDDQNNVVIGSGSESVIVNTSLIPDTTATNDLGTGGLKFRNLNLSNSVSINGSDPYVAITQGGDSLQHYVTGAYQEGGSSVDSSLWIDGNGGDGLAIVNRNGGAIDIFTNNNANGSGAIYLTTEDSGANNSGNLIFKTGDSSAVRGKIKLVDGSNGTVGHVWTQTNADGSGAWAAAAAAATAATETFVLIAGDITAGKITLANTPLAGSVHFMVRGSGVMLEGASYDFVVNGDDVEWKNDLLPAGSAELIVGDVVQVKYMY
jgi:hypothetical protein